MKIFVLTSLAFALFVAISARKPRQASSSLSEKDQINNLNFWTTTTAVPVAPPNQAAIQRCMRACLRTNEYNPMCARIATGRKKTYFNEGDLTCGKACGEGPTFVVRGSCVTGEV